MKPFSNKSRNIIIILIASEYIFDNMYINIHFYEGTQLVSSTIH